MPAWVSCRNTSGFAPASYAGEAIFAFKALSHLRMASGSCRRQIQRPPGDEIFTCFRFPAEFALGPWSRNNCSPVCSTFAERFFRRGFWRETPEGSPHRPFLGSSETIRAITAITHQLTGLRDIAVGFANSNTLTFVLIVLFGGYRPPAFYKGEESTVRLCSRFLTS